MLSRRDLSSVVMTAAAVLAGPGSFVVALAPGGADASPPAGQGADPDAALHALIAEYGALLAEDAAAGDAPSLNLDRRFEILEEVAAVEPATLAGAAAKLRLGFDDDAVRLLFDAAPLDKVGGSALRDVFRLTGGPPAG